MIFRILLFLSLLILSFESVGYALPTLGGTSGLVRMPTAHGLKFKEFNVGINYLSGISPSGNGQVNYLANLGTLEGFELGFVGQSQQQGVFLNLKYYLSSDNSSEEPLMMAIGLDNLSSYTQTDFYMVASKLFGGGFSCHVGFLAGLQGPTATTALMLGSEYYFNETMSMAVDTIGKNSVYAPNVALRFRTSPNIIFSIAGTELFARTANGASLSTTAIGLVWTDFL
jgi:hypothetical protein